MIRAFRMPWKLSFPCVAWVNTFAEFTEFGIWWTMNRCVNDLDIIVDEFIEKVFFFVVQFASFYCNGCYIL